MSKAFLPTIFLFGMPMGLIGAGLNAHHLMELFALNHDISIAIILYGWLSLAVVTLLYLPALIGFKDKSHRLLLVDEWHDPFKRSFLPAVSLTFMLLLMSLATVFEQNHTYQAWLFYASIFIAIMHLGLNLFLINGWLFNRAVNIEHHKPTWFILLSANFIIVIAFSTVFKSESVLLQELVWLYYAAALFLWIAFTTTLFYRLLFMKPLHVNLRPSLFIFLAPPSLGTIAALFISQSFQSTSLLSIDAVGLVAWFGFSFATIILILWLLKYRYFIESGLSLGAWSYVYPLAAYGLAAQYMAQALNSQLLIIYSMVIFIVLLAFIVLLSVWLIKQLGYFWSVNS